MARTNPFRMLLVGLTATALVMTVWLALTSMNLRREARERFFDQYNRQQLLVADHTSKGIEDVFRTFKRALTLTAELYHELPLTRAEALKNSGGLKAIYNVISDLPIIDLVVFDRDGTVVDIVPEEPMTLGANYSWRGYYKWARNEGAPGKMYLSPFLKLQGGQNRGEMAIMVAEGIYGPGGSFEGVVMITVNFDELVRRHILTVKMGEKGYAWLVDGANGTILVDPKGKVTGQSIEQAFLSRWPKLYELLKESSKGEERLDWYDYEDPSDPARTVRKLVAMSPVRVEKFLWTVGVCIPEDEVEQLFASYLGRQQNFSTTVIFTTLAGGVLFLGLLMWWNRSLSREVDARTSALSEAREKLETAFGELLEAKKLAAVGHMALGLVHEIRNPLSSIRMNMQMIRKRQPQASPSAENFRIMEDEILRLNKLLGDVMVFARPAPLKTSPADLAELARKTLLLTGERTRTADIRTALEAPEKPLSVLCDPEQITQVILNLVLNAVQAMENHQGERKLEIALSTDGAYAVLRVRDTGPGISPRHIESIFNPFFTTKAQGGGLGLSIASRIALAHGGTLEAERGLEKGAVFTLKLPAGGPGERKET